MPEIPPAADTAYEAVRLLMVRKTLGIVLPYLGPYTEDDSTSLAVAQEYLDDMTDTVRPGENPAERTPELFEPYLLHSLNHLIPVHSLSGLSSVSYPSGLKKRLAKYIISNPALEDVTVHPQPEADRDDGNVVELRKPRSKSKVDEDKIVDIVHATGFKRLDLVRPDDDNKVLCWRVGVVAAACWLRSDGRSRLDRRIFERYKYDDDTGGPNDGPVEWRVRKFLDASEDYDLSGWTSDGTYKKLTRMAPGENRRIRGLGGAATSHELYWRQMRSDLDNFADYFTKNHRQYED